jgi:hypothetical protein
MVHRKPEGDARERAWRTFGQGAVVAVAISVGNYLMTLDAEPDWGNVGMALLQTSATAIITYLHNKVRPAQL